jgi:uncharacterized protein (TIGR03437 family)
MVDAQPNPGTIVTVKSAAFAAPAVFDAARNLYSIGSTDSDALPATPGSAQPQPGNNSCLFPSPIVGSSYARCYSAYINKVDATGNLVFGTYLGGQTNDYGVAIAVDGSGNVYVAGGTAGLLPTTPNAALNSAPSGGFVAKLSADGSKFLYVTYLPATAPYPVAISVDAAGNAYVAGRTADFQHVAITKVSADGSSFVYTTQLGGSGNDAPAAITVDSAGHVTVAGMTSSPDFPIAGTAVQTALAGTQNAFVARLDVSGNLFFSTFLGGSLADAATSLALDSAGNIYVAGSATSLDFPTTSGAFQPEPLIPLWSTSPGGFLTKLAPDASSILYSTYIPALVQPGVSLALAIGANGDAFVAGSAGAAFPVTASAPQPCSTAFSLNTFVAHLNSTGALQDATYYGGGLGALAVSGGTVRLSDPPQTLAQIAFFAPGSSAPACLSTGAFNSATLSPAYGIVPGEVVTFTGLGLGPEQGVSYTPVAEGNAPVSLGGVQVFFNGVAVPIFYAQSNQVSVQAPAGLPSSATVPAETTVAVSLNYHGTTVGPFTFPVVDVNPGFFRLEPGVSAQAYAVNQDGTINSASNPAPRGSVIALWGTGFGLPAPSCPNGGLNLYEADSLPPDTGVYVLPVQPNGTFTVTYAGSAPTLACGIVQVNVEIGQNVTPGAVAITPGLYSNFHTIDSSTRNSTDRRLFTSNDAASALLRVNSRRTDIAQREIAATIYPIEQRQNQCRRNEKDRSHQHQRTRKKLQRIKQPTRQQPKKSPHRLNRNLRETSLRQKKLQPITRVTKIIVRLLVLLPFERHDQQQAPSRFQYP